MITIDETEAAKRFDEWWSTNQKNYPITTAEAREIFYAGFLTGYDEGQYS